MGDFVLVLLRRITMSVGYATAIRNARLQAIADAINAGAGAGKLRIYDGSRPATGGTATTLLAELTFSDPCEASVAGGVLTFDAITADSSADATGTATWARAVDSDDTFVCDMSVTTIGGGGEVQLDNTGISVGGAVGISSAAITEGNP
jgi:hypothetical protein